MSNINTEFIEKYQLVLEKDPTSRVFAPLGEAYRKMGLLKEAKEVLSDGIKHHPHFSSGRVALAKVLFEMNDFDDAAEHLLQAIEFSSENLLAHRLLAECYLKIKQPKKALKAFKMTLFLNPNDAVAKEHVLKLESLTADEYEEEIFEMKPLSGKIEDHIEMGTQTIENKIETFSKFSPNPVLRERQLERVVSLADAFIARGDLQRANSILEQGENKMGRHAEIDKRKKFIKSRIYDDPHDYVEAISPLEQLTQEVNKKKIDLLETLLQRISDRRIDQNFSR